MSSQEIYQPDRLWPSAWVAQSETGALHFGTLDGRRHSWMLDLPPGNGCLVWPFANLRAAGRHVVVIPVCGAFDELVMCLVGVAMSDSRTGAREPQRWSDVYLVCSHEESAHVERSIALAHSLIAAAGGTVSWTKPVIVVATRQLTFAQNCNLGAIAAGVAHAYTFLNTDAYVERRALGLLYEALEMGSLAAGPSADRISGQQGVALDLPAVALDAVSIGARHALIHDRVLDQSSDVTAEETRLVGFCLTVRGAAFRAVGGFSTLYRNGYEDDDLCIRLYLLGFDRVKPHRPALCYVRFAIVAHSCSRSLERDATEASANVRDGAMRFLSRWEGFHRWVRERTNV